MSSSTTPPLVPSLSSAPKQPKPHGRRKAPKRKRRILPVIVISSLVLALVGSGGYIYQLQTQIKAESSLFLSQQDGYAEQITSLQEERDELKDQISGLETDLVAKSALLASRDGFLANLAELHEVVVLAEGKLNTTDVMNKVFESQNTVFKEESDVSVVEEQNKAVQQETENLKNALADWESEQKRKQEQEIAAQKQSSPPKTNSSQPQTPSTPNPPAAPKDPLSTSRQALNDVGGSWVTLSSADIVCNMSRAVACATPGHITIATKYVNSSYGFWYDYMMHEYAHQIQFNNWSVMKASSFYQNAFNSDPEWLATCMAEHRKPGHRTGYSYSCSGEQMAYAARAWNNDFSG